MQSCQLFLECCTGWIFNSDISFTSTSTFITLINLYRRYTNQFVRKVIKLYEGLKLHYDRLASRNGLGIFHNSANNRESWSRKSDCLTLGNVITYQTQKLLRFSVCILYLVYILYPVCSLLSAFCTNRYPWHQYSLFLVTVIRTTHAIYHKIPVCDLIRHFRSFPR